MESTVRPLSYRVALGQRTVWGSGDWGRDEHDPLDGNLALGEVGAGYNFGPVQANVALGRTWTNQNLAANGDMNADGSYLWAEALAPLHGNLWGVLGGYYQWGDANVHRGYRNAGTPDTSTGSPDTRTWGIRGRLEWDGAAKPGGVSLSPYGELSYLHTHMDAYMEQGGGFPVAYDALEQHATDLRLGMNAAYPLSDRTQLLGLLAAVHRFNSWADPISGDVIGLFPFELPATAYNQNWLRAGLGVSAHLGFGVASLMVNATTEGQAPSAWVAATYQVPF
jgi:outer membrane autotransporter protein